MFCIDKFLKVLAFLGITVGLPIYLTLWILFFLWYSAIVTLSKIFKREFVAPVTGVSSFLTVDKFYKRPNCVLLHTAILEGNPDPNTVVRHLEKLYEMRNEDGSRMYKKLGYSCDKWLGYNFWRLIPNFQIKDHVHFINDGITTSENVNQFIQRIMRKPFEKGQPLWEVLVLTSRKANGDCYVVFRTHHILLDGMTLVKLWFKADGMDKMPEDLVKYNTSNLEPRPLIWRYLNYFRMIIVAPYLSNRVICTPNDKNVLTNGYKDFKGDWFCSPVNKIHLEKYREPLRVLQYSLTHVLLVAYTRGFRKFLEKHYGSANVPDSVTIFGSVPRPNHPDHKLTNQWGIMRYTAGVRIDDLRDQLEYAKKEYTVQIQCIIPEMFEFMTKLMACLPVLVSDISVQSENSGTLAISNVPGPKTQQKMFNLTVKDRAMWLPLPRQNSGVGLIFLTYNGWGNFTMTADSGYIKDRGAFDDLHRMVLEEMTFILEEVILMASPNNNQVSVETAQNLEEIKVL